MNSKKIGGMASSAAAANSSPKGKGIVPPSGVSDFGNNSPKLDQPIQAVAHHSIDAAEDGAWEVCGKKSKNRTGNGAAKQRGASTAAPKAWGHPEMSQKSSMSGNGQTGWASESNWQTQTVDSKRQAGRVTAKPVSSTRGWDSAYTGPPPVIRPPLQHGWQWASRTGSSNVSESKTSEDVRTKNNASSKLLYQGSPAGEDSGSDKGGQHPDDASDDDELVVDSDEDLESDDYDSDVSQKSHETRKKNKWFMAFFKALDSLTVEQMNEPSRQWHCPACHDGPGAIDWYRGLQPLMTHAKTKGAKRVKLHRELAELLDEELHRRGTSVIPAGELFGKWKGLRETATDHEIVWPPMVIVRNTILEQDENEKWLGMGNQELLEYFSSYDAVRARHSYGPHGHRGISILMFEASAVGYMEAERLHKHFIEQGTDREAWDHHPVFFYPGGRRQLYGYMARKEDMDIFNQHCQGKSKLKFEMRSYQEMVVSQMKRMSEDNQQLIWLKNKVAKQKQNEKVLEETVGVMSKQLRIANEENRIVMQRSKAQHEENKEEMDNMERFFKEKMDVIHESLEEKERVFEKLLQEDRERAKLSNTDSGSKEERKVRLEEIARFIDSQSKGIKEFEAEREKLIRLHEDKKTELKRRYLEEEVELEKEFDAMLTQLMDKYTPHSSEPSTNS
ncbi:protein SUPPRESSOR OF GENE SILENCING 3 homolog [Magnolia sinica]|uniref:protein SUPPRESSOR OF GENE SILENCING 3 homolog n=1 Tax=Magnolia sinica TaxID=86752 RepID=UPI00265813C1|nr:protein SUPPRESSOR OF GENE SILENCING 3 homolog [Magnolia sinica]XP_058090003.1 protein SUPPRESSOR OF GENE SILENCING 3 homolog [Magnolia sinica]XP_058090004.1 protein SUPPRESSOR OF GENE SILENCING 3 homolog [Magnolia sinica]XP_058090006.1 protein SUPPRESSOR OF GENE SILENCING 3 homolog [Magnolia sinica]